MTQELKFIPVKTPLDIQREINSANTKGKPVLLDFYADWCISCKEMDRFTFQNAEVIEKLKTFVLLRADVTHNDAEDKKLQKKYGVIAPPTILFFDLHGKEIKNSRIVGEMSADAFLSHLQSLSMESTENNKPLSKP